MTVDELLEKWLGKEGGAERANYQMFLTELTIALGLPTPHAKGMGLGDYEFEAPVKSEAIYGGKGTKRIDLYKRDHFILEAKQSQLQEGETAPDDPAEEPQTETEFDLFGAPVRTVRKAGKPRRRYDRLMEDARLQAQRYALALPDDHDTPPFLIVADIGRAFELYFDWAGNGRGYRPFPDERGYRIALADLASDAPIDGIEKTAADTLRAIWTDPASIDPRTRSARVTRDIAELLSRVAKTLEEDQRRGRADDEVTALGIEATSLFLMRTLFCMFAEDVELLEKDSFKRFLSDAEGRSDQFWRTGLENLWHRMNDPEPHGRYWSQGDTIVRYFNGNLFSGAKVYDLAPEAKNILRIAADQDWRAVEPAIFGTLLEQVLTPSERAKLGAHYTPRPYVQRLVQATMMDVLEPEWEAALAEARDAADKGDETRAIEIACAFHARLVALEVLDPACGTGNFLYVAMENLLRLESEVRQFVIGLGGTLEPAVHPNQFLGLELNPRAAVIAELVLWIGWLRFRLANTPEAIGEPVLPPLSNINRGTHGGYDAVLALLPTGAPDTENPRRPEWPEADFIVGNPPFIGGKDIRDRLGSAYAEALWKANPRVPKSADFVMQWWDRAADILTREGTRLRRFGFVTTNSITQVFSRRVIEHWLAEEESGTPDQVRGDGEKETQPSSSPRPPSRGPASSPGKLHLTLAIPDHPWTRVGEGAAAVRIAMTVAEAGPGEGRLVEITGERGLDTDKPELGERDERGRINADLSVGTDVTQIVPLKANHGLCGRGVQLMGAGFIVTPAKARELGLGRRPGLEAHIRDYRNGRDLLQRPRGVMVIDLFGLTEQEVMDRFPEVYQHVLKEVRDTLDEDGKPNGRAVNNRQSYRDLWWIFGEPRRDLRPALTGLPLVIGTSETSKHRVFHALPGEILPDNMIVVLGSSEWSDFGVLSSSIHDEWALEQGATLEDRPRYTKGSVFDPFPFPDRSEAVAAIAERLDAARKAALAENPRLTMTGLYNFVAPIREGNLPPSQEAAATAARAYIVAKLHDDLDQAVADAYGWGEEWRRAPLPPRRDRPAAGGAQRRARGGRGARPHPLAAPRLPDPALRSEEGIAVLRVGVGGG
ncbi:hypothetical protein A6F68_00356 [Tsuneonella dongtanensis]|uniref:site-specific DNA-methyltransferase (adenine-specific) n=1 Tax=Tsuneonella dongtanensis TaxID=692370 RepID=A0A1B2A9V8_9SPHN|nr:DNA methyltransferase [Tsuneonella dongtanensis]ANY18891.1 hypothetical protein A6F68_00356 [Tsuneonella dongtanensis]